MRNVELSCQRLRRLEVEVADPVDYVEQQEGGGEEHSGVGIQLPDVDVNPSFPPAALFALFVAAEEALAVFAVQALVQAVVVVVVPEQGVAHRHHGPRGAAHVQRGVGLQRKAEIQWIGFLFLVASSQEQCCLSFFNFSLTQKCLRSPKTVCMNYSRVKNLKHYSTSFSVYQKDLVFALVITILNFIFFLGADPSCLVSCMFVVGLQRYSQAWHGTAVCWVLF